MMAYDPGDYAERHQAVRDIMRWFNHDHMDYDAPGKRAARGCQAVAEDMVEGYKDCAELTAGLRKLLEAKDCFVRAALTTND